MMREDWGHRGHPEGERDMLGHRKELVRDMKDESTQVWNYSCPY